MPEGPANQKNENWALKTALAVFGTATALVTAVYVFGGVALYLRLLFAGLRTDVVISSIPREFVISVGVAILGQLFLYLLVLLLAYVQEYELGSRFWGMLCRLSITVLATALLAVPVAVRVWGSTWWKVALVVAAAATLWVLGWLLRKLVEPRAVLHGSVQNKKAARLLWSAARLVLLATVIFFGWRVALEWVSVDALGAKVCTTNPTATVPGLYIGANDSRVYIGEKRTDEFHRIAEIPRSEITRVYLGKDAEGLSCPWSLNSLTLDPATIGAGKKVTGVVALKGVAPAMDELKAEKGPDRGVVIDLSSSSPAGVVVPAKVLIPEGRSAATFAISTKRKGETPTTVITASTHGAVKTATLTVTKPKR